MKLARRVTTFSVPVVVGLAVLAGPSSSAVGDAGGPDHPLVKNVILLVDDGAGYAQHEAGSLYDTGRSGDEAYDRFPFRFAVSTYSYGDVPVGQCPAAPVGYDPGQAWADFGYVLHDPTDSAAAATAMATGMKTYDSAIGVDCSGGRLPNISEAFEQTGRSTGVVTSVPFSHATPAAFVAHNIDRDAYLAIARDMVDNSATDVIMGAGHPFFDRSGLPLERGGFVWIGSALWNRLVAGTAGGDADGDGAADPWTLIQTRSQFQALETGPTPSRVLGMAEVRRTLQKDRTGDPLAAPYVEPLIETVPTLPEMTSGALNVLDNNPKGFFLMVEGGATDLAAHDNEPGRMVEEELSFDRTVDSVLSWVQQHSNWGETLILVASDHETGYLTGPGSGQTADGPVWTPLVDNGAGMLPGMQFNSVTHTNSLVPVFAKGDAGRLLRHKVDGVDAVRGPYVDNTDIYRLLTQALNGVG